MKRPKIGIWMGVVFVLVALLALPWALNDPTGTTPRGLPFWLLPPVLLLGGAFFIVYSWCWLSRARRRG